LDADAPQVQRGAVSCGFGGDECTAHAALNQNGPDAPLSVLSAVASGKANEDAPQDPAAVNLINESTLSVADPGIDCLPDADCLPLLLEERKQSCELDVALLPAAVTNRRRMPIIGLLPTSSSMKEVLQVGRRRMPIIGLLPTSSSMKEVLQSGRIQKLMKCLKLDDIVVYDSCEPMPIWYYVDHHVPTSAVPIRKRTPEFNEGPLKCEMPLSLSVYCDACVNLGPFMNCNQHMRICHANDIFLGCPNCSRVLCGKHLDCYCYDAIANPLHMEKNTSPGQCTSRGRSNGTNPSPGS
jgi:hypothetical protein